MGNRDIKTDDRKKKKPKKDKKLPTSHNDPGYIKSVPLVKRKKFIVS